MDASATLAVSGDSCSFDSLHAIAFDFSQSPTRLRLNGWCRFQRMKESVTPSELPLSQDVVLRRLRRYSLVGVLVFAVVIALNWLVDPLQIYRRAHYPALLVEPRRFRNPGLARNCPEPLVVMGTSASVFLQPGVLKEKFGMSSLNLSMEGASAHEQYLLLRLALQSGKVREVIWDINCEYFRGSSDWVSDYDGVFPSYLYDNYWWNDVTNYLLTADTCKNSLRVLARRCGVPAYRVVGVDSFSRFPERAYGPEAVAAKMERRRQNASAFRQYIPEYSADRLRESFDRNCLSLAREFPDTRFRLYLPPFSRAYFEFLHEAAPELQPVFMEFRAMLFDRTRGLANVELHDLQSELSMLDDLSHFADPIHYDEETHVKVLELIRGGSALASAARMEAFRGWVDGVFRTGSR